ncbi:hypothetical protein [Burkholderia thailandensis]|uniref:hypothetical protein n=1 Tax=Burkholderia thailandensis TaxID=57975 RepID=UPI000B0896BF|nr:hypothetical protein [Burkholderia thailandensis]MCS6478291.1 hypothetical protein [Burkholderia thailandensis]MCS6501431.1 hypothetical protein [Burkholderia thailandensis]MCS6520558.1 hypothetical protein [Burkholderia thailandensis]WRS67868.1 hypothetical protein U9S59_25540 [Burkholderia thailandensis]
MPGDGGEPARRDAFVRERRTSIRSPPRRPEIARAASDRAGSTRAPLQAGALLRVLAHSTERLPVRLGDRAVDPPRRADRRASRDARGRRRRAASVTHWPSRAPAVPAGSVAGQLVFSLRGAALRRVVRSARRLAAPRIAAAVGIAVPAYGAAAFAHV